MNAKITQGKRQLWQWDTGVQLMLFDIGTANEVHFATPDGVIRRDIVNNMCNIPDVVLQRAGTMVCYVFNREPYEGDTRHEFHFDVLPRPKPADYIDPPGEADYLDQLYDRLKDEIAGPPGKDGVGISSLEQVRYTTADGGVNTWKATLTDGTHSLFNVTNGSKGSPGEPGAPGAPGSSGVYIGTEAPTDGANVWIDPEGKGTETLPNPHPLVINGVSYDGSEMVEIKEGVYELIETITLNGESVINLTVEPDGTPYNFSDIIVEIETSNKSDVAGHVYPNILMGDVAAAAYGLANGIAVGGKRFMATGVNITKGIAESFATSVGQDSSSATTLYRRPLTAFVNGFVDKVRITASVPFPDGTLVRIKAVRA